VGAATSDDAAVYRLTPELALVATLDFITPVVDDPSVFGAVAVANALSDVYAMGATPLLALNVVGFPRDQLPFELLGEILEAGSAKAAEVGVSVIGGHSIDNPVVLYGMVALGTVHPDRVVSNAGGQPGDALILTKPIGTGVITTAIKAGQADPTAREAAVESMTTLNAVAAHAAVEAGAHAITDVTGFGLLGHLRELALASGVNATVRASAVPLLAGTRQLAEDGFIPGGTRRNRDAVAPHVHYSASVSELHQLLLCDAQTSGGLLIAVPRHRAEGLVRELETRRALSAAVIGSLVTGDGAIEVAP
jgi:selenide,water dikinase